MAFPVIEAVCSSAPPSRGNLQVEQANAGSEFGAIERPRAIWIFCDQLYAPFNYAGISLNLPRAEHPHRVSQDVPDISLCRLGKFVFHP